MMKKMKQVKCWPENKYDRTKREILLYHIKYKFNI